MAEFYVGGVEKIEIGSAATTEAAVASISDWVTLENVALDTVLYTRNSDTQSDLFAEDKEYARLTFSQSGEPDQIAIGMLEQKPEIMNLLENNEYTAASTKLITLASRKLVNKAIRITTKALKDDRKQVIVLPNTFGAITTPTGLNKTGVQQILLTSRIGTFTTTTTKAEAISIKTWVTAAGSAIDSTPPTPPSGT